jgi:hypothetical protein
MISCISRVDTNIKRFGIEACREEILICNTFCEQAWRRVRRNLLMVDKNSDDDMMKIAGQIIDQEKYHLRDVLK